MSSQSRISIIFLVAASISLGFMCTDIYIPSMPHMARLFKVSEDSIQMTVASNLLGAVIAGLFAGTLSDSFGRRPLMLSGLVLFIIGSLIAALSPNFQALLIGRFIQGCGVGIFNVIGTATIQDLFNQKESAKAMARMEVAFTLVPSLAPIIGGHLHVYFGWRMNFYFILLISTCLLGLSYFLFKESFTISRFHKKRWHFVQNYKQLFGKGFFWRYVTLSPMLYFAEIMFYTLLPFYLSNTLALSPEKIGYCISVIILSYAAGSMITPFVLDRYNHDQTIFMSLSLICISNFFQFFLAYMGKASLGSILFLFASHEFGMALLYAPSMAKAFHIFANIKGTASSVPNILFAGCATLGAFLAGLINDLTLFTPAFVLFGVSIVTLGLFSYHILRMRTPSNDNTALEENKKSLTG